MIVFELILFLISGCAVGILASMFGLGGGVIVVPVLYWLFKFLPIDHNLIMHLAVGTSLSVMIITSINSAYFHFKRKRMIWSVIKRMIPFLILGVICGAYLSHYLHGSILHIIFLVFIACIILQALFKKGFADNYQLSDFTLPKKIIAWPVMFINGLISVLLGIGGSTITVPFLRNFKLPMVRASACSNVLTIVVALVGTVGYIVSGWNVHNIPHYAFGYIYLPALIGIAVGTFVGVPIGGKLATLCQDKVLAKIYIVLLILIFIAMAV
jgi:uncharacterized membrane protein YfcA